MTDPHVGTTEHLGGLVAFEGPQDIISTHLRLLPGSPNILVLPPIQSFFRKETTRSSFDVRSYIIETHEACDARYEIARTFLRGSTPDNKRRVFLNGGTASAHVNCIAAISKYQTNGNVVAAETIYNQLVLYGVTGLKRKLTTEKGGGIVSRANGISEIYEQDDDVLEDPISKAMRAADRLDRETAFLQDTHELDLTIRTRPRSMSVPAILVANEVENAAPFYLVSETDNNPMTRLPGTRGLDHLVPAEEEPTMTDSPDRSASLDVRPWSPSCFGEMHSAFTPSTPGSPCSRIESAPGSPIQLGEALIVDIRPANTPRRHQRLKSVDRIYAASIRNQNISFGNLSQSSLVNREQPLDTQSTELEQEDHSPKNSNLRPDVSKSNPNPKFVKSLRACVRKRSLSPLRSRAEDSSYAIQGIDPGRENTHLIIPDSRSPKTPTRKKRNDKSFLDMGDHCGMVLNEPCDPVLPMMEDLVVHFKCKDAEPRLEAMIEAFKSGTFPVPKLSLLPRPKECTRIETYGERSSSRQPALYDIPDSRHPIQESDQSDDYDPFAYYLSNLGPTSIYPSHRDSYSQSQANFVVSTPPTPAQTPPASPDADMTPKKVFHEFDISACKTAVCIQNSLRSILNAYYAPEDPGDQQFNFPLLPEPCNARKPVFREMKLGGSKAARKIDLILAIGAQKRSGKDPLNAVSGSLEKLGRESNGKSRSGRLHLRYLIASAMQAFTSQPLTNQKQDNPFSNPFLLATLIVPHLETYIAAHSSTRFLILEYPPEYLSTILTLQHLIGVDLLKIATIVDAEGNESMTQWTHRQQASPTMTHLATPTSITGTYATLLPKESRSTIDVTEKFPPTEPSFSKANFILTSTATEFEIATFISTIWRILIDTSPVYIPKNRVVVVEPELNHNSHYHYSPSSSTRSDEPYAPFTMAVSMLGFAPEKQQPPQQLGAPSASQRPITPNKPSQTLFHGDAVHWIPRHNHRNKFLQILGREALVADLAEPHGHALPLYADLEDEDEEGRFSAEDRKYMSAWANQGVVRKGTSRKALKWLGLAS